eukprot:12426770-Karenia_brevis.AAC.1
MQHVHGHQWSCQNIHMDASMRMVCRQTMRVVDMEMMVGGITGGVAAMTMKTMDADGDDDGYDGAVVMWDDDGHH